MPTTGTVASVHPNHHLHWPPAAGPLHRRSPRRRPHTEARQSPQPARETATSPPPNARGGRHPDHVGPRAARPRRATRLRPTPRDRAVRRAAARRVPRPSAGSTAVADTVPWRPRVGGRPAQSAPRRGGHQPAPAAVDGTAGPPTRRAGPTRSRPPSTNETAVTVAASSPGTGRAPTSVIVAKLAPARTAEVEPATARRGSGAVVGPTRPPGQREDDGDGRTTGARPRAPRRR